MKFLDRKLLAVDEEESFREIYQELLGRKGYVVETASAREGALNKLEESGWDAVLLDQHLRGAGSPDGGLSLIPEIVRRAPGARIILVTTYATAEALKAAFDAGAHDYLQKDQLFSALLIPKVRANVEAARALRLAGMSAPTRRISPERAPHSPLPHSRTPERAPSRPAASLRPAAMTAPTSVRLFRPAATRPPAPSLLVPARRNDRPNLGPPLPARRNARPGACPPRSGSPQPPPRRMAADSGALGPHRRQDRARLHRRPRQSVPHDAFVSRPIRGARDTRRPPLPFHREEVRVNKLRPTDGTDPHRRQARYHMDALATGSAPIHANLAALMTPLYLDLKAKARATEDAEDDWLGASARTDAAEITVENAVRNIDTKAKDADRADPSLNAQKTIFPKGFGPVIDPEGEVQLKTLPALHVRVAPFLGNADIAGAVTKLEDAETIFKQRLQEEKDALEKIDTCLAQEQEARRLIREQLDSAYGLLRDFYKGRTALAETFFYREKTKRSRPKKGDDGNVAPPAPPVPTPADGTP